MALPPARAARQAGGRGQGRSGIQSRSMRKRRGVVMTADPCITLEQKVSTRVRDDESHRRLADVLTEVAVAAMHPARHLGVGRSPCGGMLEEPIESATHAAVERLVTELEYLVEMLPRQTVDQLVDEQRVAEHGFE